MEESALNDVSSDQLLPGSLAICESEILDLAIAMHEPYKSNDMSCKNTFSIKKCSQVK